MNIEISSFADAGDHEKERVVMKALSDLDIGWYALFSSNLWDGMPTSGLETAYWFPDDHVKTGDLVVLYTKDGVSSKKERNDGSTAHFYYWGRRDSVWGSSEKTAVIVRIAEWAHRVPGR